MEPLLRHTLATLSYRLGKVVRDAPDEFATYPAGEAQTAGKILAHIGDLLEWALSMVNGEQKWQNSTPLAWRHEVERLYTALSALDSRVAEIGAGASTPERLFQGPVADALTHTGQLAMMRRLAGLKMNGENYYLADIVAGRVGPEQTPPRRVF